MKSVVKFELVPEDMINTSISVSEQFQRLQVYFEMCPWLSVANTGYLLSSDSWSSDFLQELDQTHECYRKYGELCCASVAYGGDIQQDSVLACSAVDVHNVRSVCEDDRQSLENMGQVIVEGLGVCFIKDKEGCVSGALQTEGTMLLMSTVYIREHSVLRYTEDVVYEVFKQLYDRDMNRKALWGDLERYFSNEGNDSNNNNRSSNNNSSNSNNPSLDYMQPNNSSNNIGSLDNLILGSGFLDTNTPSQSTRTSFSQDEYCQYALSVLSKLTAVNSTASLTTVINQLVPLLSLPCWEEYGIPQDMATPSHMPLQGTHAQALVRAMLHRVSVVLTQSFTLCQAQDITTAFSETSLSKFTLLLISLLPILPLYLENAETIALQHFHSIPRSLSLFHNQIGTGVMSIASALLQPTCTVEHLNLNDGIGHVDDEIEEYGTDEDMLPNFASIQGVSLVQSNLPWNASLVLASMLVNRTVQSQDLSNNLCSIPLQPFLSPNNSLKCLKLRACGLTAVDVPALVHLTRHQPRQEVLDVSENEALGDQFYTVIRSLALHTALQGCHMRTEYSPSLLNRYYTRRCSSTPCTISCLEPSPLRELRCEFIGATSGLLHLAASAREECRLITEDQLRPILSCQLYGVNAYTMLLSVRPQQQSSSSTCAAENSTEFDPETMIDRVPSLVSVRVIREYVESLCAGTVSQGISFCLCNAALSSHHECSCKEIIQSTYYIVLRDKQVTSIKQCKPTIFGKGNFITAQEQKFGKRLSTLNTTMFPSVFGWQLGYAQLNSLEVEKYTVDARIIDYTGKLRRLLNIHSMDCDQDDDSDDLDLSSNASWDAVCKEHFEAETKPSKNINGDTIAASFNNVASALKSMFINRTLVLIQMKCSVHGGEVGSNLRVLHKHQQELGVSNHVLDITLPCIQRCVRIQGKQQGICTCGNTGYNDSMSSGDSATSTLDGNLDHSILYYMKALIEINRHVTPTPPHILLPPENTIDRVKKILSEDNTIIQESSNGTMQARAKAHREQQPHRRVETVYSTMQLERTPELQQFNMYNNIGRRAPNGIPSGKPISSPSPGWSLPSTQRTKPSTVVNKKMQYLDIHTLRQQAVNGLQQSNRSSQQGSSTVYYTSRNPHTQL